MRFKFVIRKRLLELLEQSQAKDCLTRSLLALDFTQKAEQLQIKPPVSAKNPLDYCESEPHWLI